MRSGIFESVCYVITLKCNLSCKHCFVECSPERTEVVDFLKIDQLVDNSAKYCKRVWISGGEATLYPDIVKKIVDRCKITKGKYGYPKEICLQTNGCWGKSDSDIFSKLEFYERIGITDLDISGDDIYHYEQIGNCLTPRRVYEIAVNKFHFKTVNIAGSPLKNIKLLGRAKKFQLRSSKEDNNCICFNDNFLIYPNGEIYNCKWAITEPFGNIYSCNLLEAINSEYAEFARILFAGGVNAIEKALAIKNIRVERTEQDICDYCKKITKIFNEKHNNK